MSSIRKNELTAPGRRLAFRQILIMVISVTICTILIYSIWGLSYAQSSLSGGLVGIIPNVIFAYKAFKYAGAQASQKVISSFFAGAKLKLALTAFLLALSFKFLVRFIEFVPVAYFGTFFLVVFISVLTPLFFNKNFKL